MARPHFGTCEFLMSLWAICTSRTNFESCSRRRCLRRHSGECSAREFFDVRKVRIFIFR
jgi:hypothetical protein